MISVAELKEHMRTFEVNEEASDTVSEGPKVDGETPNPRAVASSVKAASECTIPILTSRGPPAFHDIKLFEFEDQLAIGIPCQVAIRCFLR